MKPTQLPIGRYSSQLPSSADSFKAPLTPCLLLAQIPLLLLLLWKKRWCIWGISKVLFLLGLFLDHWWVRLFIHGLVIHFAFILLVLFSVWRLYLAFLLCLGLLIFRNRIKKSKLTLYLILKNWKEKMLVLGIFYVIKKFVWHILHRCSLYFVWILLLYLCLSGYMILMV